MRRIDRLLAHYGESHQNPANILIHKICVPTIVFTVYGLLWAIPVPASIRQTLVLGDVGIVNAATLVFLAGLLYYLRLSLSMTLGMALMSGVFLFILGWLERAGLPIAGISLAIFVLAWIGQFVGHKIEGKKPSFFEDLQFLLVGPAWTLSHLYRKLGIPF